MKRYQEIYVKLHQTMMGLPMIHEDTTTAERQIGMIIGVYVDPRHPELPVCSPLSYGAVPYTQEVQNERERKNKEFKLTHQE